VNTLAGLPVFMAIVREGTAEAKEDQGPSWARGEHLLMERAAGQGEYTQKGLRYEGLICTR